MRGADHDDVFPRQMHVDHNHDGAVVGWDEYGLDGDNDGIGCESS